MSIYIDAKAQLLSWSCGDTFIAFSYHNVKSLWHPSLSLALNTAVLSSHTSWEHRPQLDMGSLPTLYLPGGSSLIHLQTDASRLTGVTGAFALDRYGTQYSSGLQSIQSQEPTCD